MTATNNQIDNLVALLDGYVSKGGHHLNVNVFSKEKINPMLGAAGISAFPMASRVVAKMGTKEDPSNHLLMHAVGANVSGQVASAVAGGIILGFFM